MRGKYPHKILGRKIIVGYNAEKTLRYGIHRERAFTAVGAWPLIIAISTKSEEPPE